MSFPLVLRSPLQSGDHLRPAMSTFGDGLPVVLDEADGAVRDLTASGITVREQDNGHVRVTHRSRRATDVLVTDARVILVGERHADRLAAGHVRLDWIVAVGGSTGRGFFRSDELRLVLQHADGAYAVVTLAFDSDVDVHEVAQDIAQRAAQAWLATGTGPDVQQWQALASAPKLAAPEGEFALHFAPSYVRVAGAAVPAQYAATA